MTNTSEVLIKALKKSGQIIRENIGGDFTSEYKGEIDIVTEIDKRCEDTVIATIKESFDDHAILAEESGGKKEIQGPTWIIDPLDGTTNFFHSYPSVCTSIALADTTGVLVGGIYDPLRDELFRAEKGTGAFLNEKVIKVSKAKDLNTSLLATGFPYDRREKADYYLKFFKEFMMRTQGTRRAGAAALDLCHVACGRLDGFWEFNLKPWDIAAGILIVEESGGTVSDFLGNKIDLFGNQTLASNGNIHAEMVKVLKPNL